MKCISDKNRKGDGAQRGFWRKSASQQIQDSVPLSDHYGFKKTACPPIHFRQIPVPQVPQVTKTEKFAFAHSCQQNSPPSAFHDRFRRKVFTIVRLCRLPANK